MQKTDKIPVDRINTTRIEHLTKEEEMQIRINVKGASRKKPTIHQRVEEYPDREMTVEEFLTETVRHNVREYNENPPAKSPMVIRWTTGKRMRRRRL